MFFLSFFDLNLVNYNYFCIYNVCYGIVYYACKCYSISKNFSCIYTEEKGWRLAPAYDLTYSDTYFGEHTTSVNGKGKDINDEDLIKVGIEAGLSKTSCNTILEKIKKETESLREYLNAKPLKSRKKVSWKDRVKEIGEKSNKKE